MATEQQIAANRRGNHHRHTEKMQNQSQFVENSDTLPLDIIENSNTLPPTRP